MHEIKKLNFARSFPGRPFPAHRDLSAAEVEDKRENLSINGMAAASRESLTRMIDSAKPIAGMSAESDDFDLGDVFRHLRIPPPSNIYVWYLYDDEMVSLSTADVARYFDDFWYPSSDDVGLFDNSGRWIIFVTHYGELRVIKSDEAGATSSVA